MATKKTKEAVEEKDIDSIINAQFSDLEDLSKETEPEEWIDSGCYALNYTSSKHLRHGYAVGKSTALAGLSGTGKSMLPITAARDPKVKKVILIDSEGGGSGKSLAEFVGTDLKKIAYKAIDTLDSYRVVKKTGKIESIKDSDIPASGKLETDDYVYHRGLINFLQGIIFALQYNGIKNSGLVIIIDSLTNIFSVRRGKLGGEDMGLTQKLLNVLFNMDAAFAETKTTLLFANKVYTNFDNPYDPFKVSGGQAVMYNPSALIMLSTLSDVDDVAEDRNMDDEKKRRKTSLGSSLKIVRATMKKSRFGTEGRNAWFLIDSTYGIVKYAGLFKLLKDFGLVEKRGAMYAIPAVFKKEDGSERCFYKKDFVKVLRENEDAYIDALQLELEKKEEFIKKQRIAMLGSINDTKEAEEMEKENATGFLTEDDDEETEEMFNNELAESALVD